MLIIELFIPIGSAIALAQTFYWSCEGIYITGAYSFFSSNGFTPLTNRSNVLVSAVLLLSIPFTIKKIKDPNYSSPKWLGITKFASFMSLITVFFITVISFIPSIFISGYDIQYLLKEFFGDKQVITHVINAILCIVYICIDKEEMKFKMPFTFIGLVPLCIYTIEYGVCVFGVGCWDDYYKMKEVMKAATVPGFVALLILCIALCYGLTWLLWYINNKKPKEKKQKIKTFE